MRRNDTSKPSSRKSGVDVDSESNGRDSKTQDVGPNGEVTLQFSSGDPPQIVSFEPTSYLEVEPQDGKIISGELRRNVETISLPADTSKAGGDQDASGAIAGPIIALDPATFVATSEAPFLLLIETPRPNQMITSGPISVTGLAVAAEPIQDIVVRLGEISQAASHGIHRPDLAAEFPGIPSISRSGFSCTLREIPQNGEEQLDLEVTARTTSGRKSEAKVPVRLASSHESGLVQFETKIDDQLVLGDITTFQGYIDGIDTEWRLCGWAYDPSGGEPLRVELVENETVIASAQATQFRQDILDAGLGEGKCAFYIQIPSDLFDGGFHNLTIYGVSGGHRKPMGKPFGTVFPRLGRRHDAAQTFVPAIKIFEQVTETKSANGSRPSNELVNELADVLRKIGLRFGHSAALGLLYAYALRRSIDKDGLVTRLKRIHSNLSEYEGIVAEVMFSQEAATIHGSSNYLTLDPIGCLRTWLDKRFGLLELPE
jgi:hypothetical protein